jgi:serine/threonine protein kinase
MGTVWRGHDEVLGRPVAVKEVRFPPQLGEQEQEELRKRTLREARATASLSHPNVVTTYDVVEEDGLPYIVMELLRARSLSDILREEGPLPPHRVAQIGLEVLGALELSHRKGVVHRDVKPGNVLINDDGRAILTDFGIATMAGDPALTSTGVVLGSPAYMSPERARGKKPGPEADMWSLGATLYAAAEGRPPYDGENALGTLTAVINDPVVFPRVGGPLGAAILGLLEKEPADRMSIPKTRALLEKAAADRSAPATTVAASTADLDRAGRTTALPMPAAVAPVAAAPVPAAPAAAEPPAPVAEPAPGPSVWRDDDDQLPPDARRRSRAGILLAVLAMIAVLAGLGYAAASRNDDPKDATASDPTSSPSASQSASETASTTPPESSAPESTPESTPAGQSGVPAGFTLHKDPTGFRVAVPDGWQPVRDGPRVDFREPGGSRFLRVDQTDDPKPDAKADWERQEQSVSQRLPNYQRIRIDRVDYRDYNAADWEFTFGNNTHVLNRGMNTGAMGYALYFSSPNGQWDDSQSILQTIYKTFRPAG